jgi:hypothetical protein
MLKVCREKIKEELNEIKFVALMADETSDVSEHLQMVTVYRYEMDGNVHERFWGFFNPEGQSAADILDCILTELNGTFSGDSNKIIAQTFDGAAVMLASVNGVQSKIKECFPLAHYVHCYAYQLNLIMERAASQNRSARVFFCSLSAFPTFSSRSPHRVSVLDKVATRRITSGSATRWNFKSRTVNAVYENQDALVECFSELEKSLSNKTLQEARELRHNLEDGEFVFWLRLFHRLMPHVDILYNQIQARKVDAVKVKNAVTEFISAIDKIRNGTDATVTEEEKEDCQLDGRENKRRRIESQRIPDAKEVCDRITVEARARFQCTNHLDTSKLLDSVNFAEYSKKFPDNILDLAVESYPILNKNRLRTELSVLYERSDFRNVDAAIPLLQLICCNNLQDTFSEITTLLRIIVTIPMTTAEPERCFSSLKRIKTFLRNTMNEDRLTALAMLSIEKTLVSSINDFNTKVIEKFASKKNRRIDLNFRH